MNLWSSQEANIVAALHFLLSLYVCVCMPNLCLLFQLLFKNYCYNLFSLYNVDKLIQLILWMLVVSSAFWVSKCNILCQILEVFSHYFFKCFFSATFSLFSWDADDVNVTASVIVAQVPEAVHFLLNLFFSPVVQTGEFLLIYP